MFEDVDSISLNDKLRELAEKELGETQELQGQALRELKEKILALPEADQLKDLSSQSLIRFLRSRKYDISKALDFAVEYQKFLSLHDAELAGITEAEILHFHQAVTVFQDPENLRIVVIVRLKKILEQFSSEYKTLRPSFFLRFRFFLFERLSHNPYAQICGTVLIFSCKDVTFWEELKLPQICSVADHKASFRHFNILGTRMKGSYMFQEPGFLSWLWYFISPMMSQKIRSRFHFCGRHIELIHQAVSDVSILPESLGGKLSEESELVSWWILSECNKCFPK